MLLITNIITVLLIPAEEVPVGSRTKTNSSNVISVPSQGKRVTIKASASREAWVTPKPEYNHVQYEEPSLSRESVVEHETSESSQKSQDPNGVSVEVVDIDEGTFTIYFKILRY